jgi:hypothetical protein
MTIDFAKQHKLGLREIGLLWVISQSPESFDPENFEQSVSDFDAIEVLFAIEALKEKGLMEADIMAKEIAVVDREPADKYKDAFDKVRIDWPQRSGKRGLEIEWEGFLKACKKFKLNYRNEVSKLRPAMDGEKAIRSNGKQQGKNEGEWPYPMFCTWINQARWTNAITAPELPQERPVSEKYKTYLAWYNKRYGASGAAVGRELTEEQYITISTMSGPMQTVKISIERARTITQEAHDQFLANPKPGSFLYEFILQKIKEAAK